MILWCESVQSYYQTMGELNDAAIPYKANGGELRIGYDMPPSKIRKKATIVTEWVPFPELRCQCRFTGPEWLAQFLLRWPIDGGGSKFINRLNLVLRPIVKAIGSLCGAKLEWTELDLDD